MSSSKISLEHLFKQLHQTQINLIQNTNKSSINEYSSQIETICSSRIVQNNANNENDAKPALEFLLLPLLTCLKRLNHQKQQQQRPNNWSDLNEALLKSVLRLLATFGPIDRGIFSEVLNISSIMLAHLESMSDELMSVCFRVISTLFTAATRDHICGEFFKFSNLTTIGLLVSKLLDVLSASKSIEVRLDALDAFKSMLTPDTDECQHRIGVIYASFLPGISIKLMQKFLLAENLKLLNHKLICAGLQALKLVVASVFDDFLLDDRHYRHCFESCMNGLATNKNQTNLKSLIVNRLEHKTWTHESSEKVFYLIDRLLDALVKHDNVHTKLEMIELCSLVSQRCYFSLNSYLDKLLNVLVTYAVDVDDDDENEENHSTVIQRATQAIESLENKEINSNYKFVQPNRFSLVSSSIHELLLKLPRLMTATDAKIELSDDSRKSYMRTVYGHLKLIGRRSGSGSCQLVDFFLANPSNLNQLLDALVNCVKFDYSTLTNFYEITSSLSSSSTTTTSQTSGLSSYKGSLDIYLHDKSLYGSLRNICVYLGRSDAARLCVDALLHSDLVLLESRRYKLEALFLINLILVGLEKRNDEEKNQENISIASMILNSQLNEATKTSGNNRAGDAIDVIETLDLNENKTHMRNRYILQICLTLEIISTTSRFYTSRNNPQQQQQLQQPKDHLVFLIDTLYFTLDNYVSANLLIKCVSTRCLDELARNLGYARPSNLLSANYDLLMNDLILKSNALLVASSSSHHHQQQQQNLTMTKCESHVHVLCALIYVSDADLCAHLERLVDDYFLAAQLNASNAHLVDGICRILAFMARSMRRWYPVKFNFLTTTSTSDGSSSGEESCDLATLNLDMYAQSKKRDDERKSFLDSLRELDAHLDKQQRDRKLLFEDDNNNQVKTDEQNQEENDEELQEGEMKREAPLHVRLQSKCLELCTHLISHPNREIRLRVISLIGELSKNLAEHTNDYLPLVHKLWSPICHRFSLDDLVVKSRIIYVLFEITLLSGDFLGQRFVKEFVPRLCQFMREQSKQSVNASVKNPTYVYSHAYKLQCAVLEHIDKMCLVVDIKESQLECMLEQLLVAYLDRRQPKRLQSLAVQAMRNCALVDADVVWLVLLVYVLPFGSLQHSERRDSYERVQAVFRHAGMKIFVPKCDLQLNDDVLANLLDLFNTLNST